MESKFMDITPAMAVEWLKKNMKNRRVQPNRVKEYSEAMKAGLWRANGESIKFDLKGNLVDGQHRLMACAQTGITITVNVVTGIEPEAVTTIDIGKHRNHGDTLAMAEFTNCRIMAAMLILVHKYRTGTCLSKSSFTNAQVLGLAETTNGKEEAITVGDRVYRSLRGQKSVYAAAAILFKEADQELSEKFFSCLANGLEDKTKATFILRNRIIAQTSRKEILPQHELFALMIKAWNHFASGTVVKCLRWRNAGDAPEVFPEILGLENKSQTLNKNMEAAA
jgi:hypothetical protein